LYECHTFRWTQRRIIEWLIDCLTEWDQVANALSPKQNRYFLVSVG
jgi:hypothetical protein